MAKIITLPSSDVKGQPGQNHLEAGWLLVYTALWQHDNLPKSEIAYAQQMIRRTFTDSTALRPAFMAYCERILVANRILQVEPAQWIDVPSIWFHPDYVNGFSGTLSTHQLFIQRRQTIPGYQQGMAIFARAYWDYANQPSQSILKICRRKLLQQREYGLLQLWNNVIMLHQSK